MHPLLTLVTDNNPSWIGIVWPETPPKRLATTPSPRITNSPDLLNEGETYDIFSLPSTLMPNCISSWLELPR